MRFSLVVQAPPASRQGSHSAYRFAQTLLTDGHELYRVFFYGDGIHNASRLYCPPKGEPNLPKLWQTLAQTYQLDLVVCIAAAMRRGLVDSNEAKRHHLDADNLLSGFQVSGLGQLIDATAHSDRVVSFD